MKFFVSRISSDKRNYLSWYPLVRIAAHFSHNNLELTPCNIMRCSETIAPSDTLCLDGNAEQLLPLN